MFVFRKGKASCPPQATMALRLACGRLFSPSRRTLFPSHFLAPAPSSIFRLGRVGRRTPLCQAEDASARPREEATVDEMSSYVRGGTTTRERKLSAQKLGMDVLNPHGLAVLTQDFEYGVGYSLPYRLDSLRSL